MLIESKAGYNFPASEDYQKPDQRRIVSARQVGKQRWSIWFTLY